MPTTHLHGNERMRVQITPIKKDIFIDIDNEQDECLTARIHCMHFFQVRKKSYAIKVFVFESQEQIIDFDFRDFADAEIIYTNIH